MPRAACTVCGGTALPGSSRCGLHPRAATPAQKRGYRGLAAYRAIRARVLAGDPVCTDPTGIGCRAPADELGHVTPYVEQDPATRDDPTTWRDEDFRPVCADCNKRLGARPMPD
jgi:5-methylcytosine-specific restriction endonuclease McrA